MSMKDRTIIIDDWACNRLFVGDYEDREVDKILDTNRCSCESGVEYQFTDNGVASRDCSICNGTGYKGDFTVVWVDSQNDEDCLNVYDYINY